MASKEGSKGDSLKFAASVGCLGAVGVGGVCFLSCKIVAYYDRRAKRDLRVRGLKAALEMGTSLGKQEILQ